MLFMQASKSSSVGAIASKKVEGEGSSRLLLLSFLGVRLRLEDRDESGGTARGESPTPGREGRVCEGEEEGCKDPLAAAAAALRVRALSRTISDALTICSVAVMHEE